MLLKFILICLLLPIKIKRWIYIIYIVNIILYEIYMEQCFSWCFFFKFQNISTWGVRNKIDFLSLSYTRHAEDVREVSMLLLLLTFMICWWLCTIIILFSLYMVTFNYLICKCRRGNFFRSLAILVKPKYLQRLKT